MKLVIYGMPCSGKTTLMNTIAHVKVLHGSEVLNLLSGGRFSELSPEDKKRIRVEYTRYVNSLDDECIISDGHYSFIDDVVFTPEDGDLYDVFFYLYCDENTLSERYRESEKNSQYKDISTDVLKRWQKFEIDSLREECHKRNKDFYVISDNLETCSFLKFMSLVRSGFSAVSNARSIVESIKQRFEITDDLYIVDGDKTVIEQDSFRYCYDGKTSVFDGNHYSCYQSFLFKNELETTKLPELQIEGLAINNEVWNMIKGEKYIVLSSGISDLWKLISEKFSLTNIYADIMISSDTKYYVVKYLKELGYKTIAIGDSKMDLYMLREADKGYLYIGDRISRSLRYESLDGLNLIYNKTPIILSEEDDSLHEDITICKSNSGINGHLLASAHYRLGEKIGLRLSKIIPDSNTALIVLERGGRFFGDGVYCAFGGSLFPYNPSKESLPDIKCKRIVIIDSVINTGKSIIKLINELEQKNPNSEILVISNVIQENALKLFDSYKVIAIRVSGNSFVGKNQPKQIGKTGPDTADRLFNLIDGCIF